MTYPLQDLVADSRVRGCIAPGEILQLRRMVWSDGAINAGEAEAIIAINAALTEPDVTWTDFFVEALSTWLVDQQEPRGHVDEGQARWLLDRIDRGGRPATMAELELLVHLLEKAMSAPDALRRYALAQVESAVLTGMGPTRDGGQLEPGRVTTAEARLLRRVIFAAGSEGPASVSADEADMLFRIKNATLDADNAPDWRLLFVQGVANFLQGLAGPAPLSRARQAELEAFMAAPGGGLGGFFGRMTQVRPDSLSHEVHRALGFGRKGLTPLADRSAEAAEAAARIDPAEQAWLDSHIHADGQVDAYEQALLDFLAKP